MSAFKLRLSRAKSFIDDEAKETSTKELYTELLDSQEQDDDFIMDDEDNGGEAAAADTSDKEEQEEEDNEVVDITQDMESSDEEEAANARRETKRARRRAEMNKVMFSLKAGARAASPDVDPARAALLEKTPENSTPTGR